MSREASEPKGSTKRQEDLVKAIHESFAAEGPDESAKDAENKPAEAANQIDPADASKIHPGTEKKPEMADFPRATGAASKALDQKMRLPFRDRIFIIPVL